MWSLCILSFWQEKKRGREIHICAKITRAKGVSSSSSCYQAPALLSPASRPALESNSAEPSSAVAMHKTSASKKCTRRAERSEASVQKSRYMKGGWNDLLRCSCTHAWKVTCEGNFPTLNWKFRIPLSIGHRLLKEKYQFEFGFLQHKLQIPDSNPCLFKKRNRIFWINLDILEITNR